MTFAKHKGQRLDEIPTGYRSWLISQEIYADKADLKAALIEGRYLESTDESCIIPKIPTKKRTASETEPSSPSPGAKKLAISKEAKRNGTMLNFDGAVYILGFGKHAGLKLREVPSAYIDWLIETKVHEKRPDLMAALRNQGMLVENFVPDILDSWRAPSIFEIKDDRFFDLDTNTPLWICDSDASRYFRLGDPLLTQVGVRLLSDEDLKRSSELPELVVPSARSRRWLHQVYACASRYGSVESATGGTHTVANALTNFLQKNRRREGEIMQDLGLVRYE